MSFLSEWHVATCVCTGRFAEMHCCFVLCAHHIQQSTPFQMLKVCVSRHPIHLLCSAVGRYEHLIYCYTFYVHSRKTSCVCLKQHWLA